MVRTKTPQQKKKESYAHDRVDRGEYLHADRRNRPLVKARGRRELRRVSKLLLASQPEEVLQMPGLFRQTWHGRSISLPEHLERVKRRRIEREEQNVSRARYGPESAARFRRIVKSLMKDGRNRSAALAEFYSGVLNRFPDETQGREFFPGLTELREMVARAFANSPGLKLRFQKWIASV
jgi:hypothetical protein